MKTGISAVWISGWILISTSTLTQIVHAQNAGPAALSSNSQITRSTRANPALENKSPTPSEVRLSFWAGEILKLVDAGIDEDVTLSFVDNLGTINLGADQIIYFQNRGASRELIAAMLRHDFEINYGLRPLPLTTPITEPITSPLTSIRTPENTIAPANAPGPPNSESLPEKPAGNPIEENPNAPLVPGHADFAFHNDNVAPDLLYFDDVTSGEPGSPSVDPSSQPKITGGLQPYAVREPYPVKLLDPIVVIKAPGRSPNLLLVQVAR